MLLYRPPFINVVMRQLYQPLCRQLKEQIKFLKKKKTGENIPYQQFKGNRVLALTHKLRAYKQC